MSEESSKTKKEEHQEEANNRVYRVDVIPHPFDWRDALYLIYVIVTATAAFVAWRALFAIKGQGKLMEGQLCEIQKARQQTDQLIARAVDQVTEMRNAGTQTERLISQAAEQAEAARKTAEAANKNASALINSERAWIMVDVEFPNQVGQLQQFTRPEGKRTGLEVKLICRNKGRTPAWITEYKIQVDIRSLLPEKPTFKNPRTSQCYIPLEVAGDKEILIKLVGEGWSEPATGTETFVYGVVKYRDIFSPDRETWFGYLVTDNTLSRIQSHEYNKHE